MQELVPSRPEFMRVLWTIIKGVFVTKILSLLTNAELLLHMANQKILTMAEVELADRLSTSLDEIALLVADVLRLERLRDA